jgi:methylthioribose-1-phosphate isomerase
MASFASSKFGQTSVAPISVQEGRIFLLDQRKLPSVVTYFEASELHQMCFAIKEMIVRGAPAIGAAAALGLANHAAKLAGLGSDHHEFLRQLNDAASRLNATRPTAVNLSWDVNLIASEARTLVDAGKGLSEIAESLNRKADSIISGYITQCRQIGDYGAQLIADEASVLTHCNAGALATCGWGTALGIIRSACERGSKLSVFVDETRPRQQGARLTAWELLQDGITPTLITDSMAGYLMSRREIDMVIIGADRIACNGDVANKIGSYSLAVLANAHNLPFYVAAPLSTIDPSTASGNDIPIEEREAREVTSINESEICPPGVNVLNPAFDVTPHHLVSAIVTEVGILRPPYSTSIARALSTRT